MTTKTESNKDVGSEFVQSAVPLMKEYTGKLEALVREAKSIQESFANLESKDKSRQRVAREQLSVIKRRVARLTPPVNDLNRRVSQMIEHGLLESELDRVELKLRLAELENATFTAGQIPAHVPT